MVVILLAPGFEEIEALVPADVLRRANHPVTLVSVTPEESREVTGAHGITVRTDDWIGSVDIRQARMLVLPGGMPGTSNLERNEAVREAVRIQLSEGRLLGAICAAPSIPGRMGLLQGRRATCYPGFEDTLQGATTSQDPVVTDGNLVTSRGPGTAMAFALALAGALSGSPEETRELAGRLLAEEPAP